MKTKNPSACSSRIEPYIHSTRRRSTADIARNDWRIIAPMRGFCDAVGTDTISSFG